MMVFLIIFFGIVLLLLVLALCHHILLMREKKRILPIGKMVRVNEHSLHIYTTGAKKSELTLVLMSGSGTTAPVYDFKPLYEKLSDDFHIAVVEKIGYGYSDTVSCPRDLDTMLEETRQALILSGETAPYVLLPHSMSGLEALYWAQKYPQEIKAIIGLDMASPQFYHQMKISSALLWAIHAVTLLGIQRIPLLKVTSKDQLNIQEFQQAKYLGNRNLYNIAILREGQAVYNNYKMVECQAFPETKFLLFASNGKEIGKSWISHQQDLAVQAKGELVCLDCGHYIHHFKANEIAAEIKAFLQDSEFDSSGK